jgi:hypothetical protein
VTSYQNQSTSNSGSTNYGYSITYTPNSNVKTDVETVDNPASGAISWSWTYNYDTLNRLSSAISSGAIQFGCAETYDAFANRTAQEPMGAAGSTCTSINTPVNANNRLSGPTYSYDAAGNLLNDGTNTLTYDGRAVWRPRSLPHSGSRPATCTAQTGNG